MKSVLITGCSAGGIGSAFAVEFEKRGLRVFATARNISKMSHLEKIPNLTILELDPTSASSVEAACVIVKAATGGTLDYLVNNAGQTIIMPTLDFDIETAKSMYDINLWRLILVTQVFAPLVIATKGTIANMSSIGTAAHTPWMGEPFLVMNPRKKLAKCRTGIYSGSKSAISMVTDTFRMEMAPFGVKVVTILTRAIATHTLDTGLNFTLPPTSLYRSIEKTIAGRAVGEDGTPRMQPSVFAEKVVGDILGGANWPMWRGGYASIVKFTSSWFHSFLSVG